jgi:hypothetical protein
MIADDGKVFRGGQAMGGEVGMGVIEVGEGGTSDDVINCSSSCCSSLVFHVGEQRGMMGIKIAHHQAVSWDGDNVCKLQGISRGLEEAGGYILMIQRGLEMAKASMMALPRRRGEISCPVYRML